jgi:transposase-like protein
MNPKVAAAFLVVLHLGSSHGHAQEKRGESESASLPRSTRLFDRPIDYWRTGATFEPPKVEHPTETDPAAPKIQVRENVWAQPIRMPDGSWTIYVPPRAVLDFLETPSKETAKAYLAWKTEQAEKLRRAFLLLAEAKGEAGGVEPSRGEKESVVRESEQPGSLVITYFHQKACRHCGSQDEILSKWLTRHPKAKLDLVEGGERPELWKAYQVRGTPTLVLRDLEQGEEETLVGLSDEKRLDDALLRLRAKKSKAPAEPDLEEKK